jgi:hypothetical protein
MYLMMVLCGRKTFKYPLKYGISGDISDNGVAFVRVLWFALPTVIPPILHVSTVLSSEVCIAAQLVANVLNELSHSTPPN